MPGYNCADAQHWDSKQPSRSRPTTLAPQNQCTPSGCGMRQVPGMDLQVRSRVNTGLKRKGCNHTMGAWQKRRALETQSAMPICSCADRLAVCHNLTATCQHLHVQHAPSVTAYLWVSPTTVHARGQAHSTPNHWQHASIWPSFERLARSMSYDM